MKTPTNRRRSFFITFAFLMLACTWHALAQATNTPAATPPFVPPTDVITVYGFGSAFAAMLHYAGVSPANIGYITLGLHFVCKYAINYPLKNSTGKFANIVSHIAIEGSVTPPAPAK